MRAEPSVEREHRRDAMPWRKEMVGTGRKPTGRHPRKLVAGIHLEKTSGVRHQT